MTEGDRMLVRAIDAALIAHPFICPVPVALGGGGTVKLNRSTARALSTRLQQMEREQREVRRRRTALALVGGGRSSGGAS